MWLVQAAKACITRHGRRTLRNTGINFIDLKLGPKYQREYEY